MNKTSKIYTVRNGVLTAREQIPNPSPQPQTQKIIRYSHTTRPSVDEYHTQIIKQYRKQNQQLKKQLIQLQKAYYNLLGYCTQNIKPNLHLIQNINNQNQYQQSTPINYLYRDKDSIFPNSTQVDMQKSITKHSSANVSSFQLQQILLPIEQSMKKQGRLSQSILEQQDQLQQFRNKINQNIKHNNSHLTKQYKPRNAKTQTDENIQQLLSQAFKQVQQLKEMLETVKNNSMIEIDELKNQYDIKIDNLQSIIDRQRNQSRMLNNIINRMRQQIQNKQNFFKYIKQMRNGAEKQFLDRLVKQHKIVI